MSDRTQDSVKSPFARNKEQIKFTLEEIKVIKDCNRESIFKRSIPIGTLLGLGTYYGVQSGYLKPNVKLGASPKVIGAVALGFFIGRISYQTKCAERIMQLPNSQLGELLRQKRRGQLQESVHSGLGSSLSLAPFGNISSSDTYSDVDIRPSYTLDLDTQRPQFEGLDESFRPSVDNPIYEEEMPPIQKHVTTYEELRKQNREEYQQKRTENVRESSTPKTAPVYQRKFASISEISAAKNKYGDEMD